MTNTKKVVKRAKKVNPKDIAKARAMEIFKTALEAEGLEFEEGTDFGMTKGTLVIHFETCDVQIKPIGPKAGLDRYQKIEIEYE